MNKSVSNFKTALRQNLMNLPGWRTKRKIVVIESDDWGSIRTPTKEVYNKFNSNGFDITGSDYNRFDSLESNDDLNMLFEVLQKHKHRNGARLAITANCVVGNPNFQKIRQSDFNEYFHEPVTVTLKRYPGRENVEALWKEGSKLGIFHPQFHAREHVNVVRWMNALRERTPEMMFTFDNETTFSGDGDYNFMEVLDYNTPEDMIKMKESLVEGFDLFEQIFGYRSKSFIPPCYTWDSEVEKTLHENGVKYIQGLIVQQVPTGTFEVYKKKYHFIGSRNKFGQYYLIRNAFFEPALSKSTDPVGECLRRINIAFRWKKPAIISSHRINYMGSLDPKNRDRNLKLLDELLRQVLKRWPEVEFMTSDELGDLIAGSGEE